MDFIEKISSDIDGFLKPIFTDKISSSIISLILVLYAGLAAPKLPKSISKLFENKIFKLIVLVIIAYTASKDASVAIITAVALVLSMQTLSNYEKPVKVVKKVEEKQDKIDDKKTTDLQEPASYDTKKNQYHELKHDNDNIPEIKASHNTHNKIEAKENNVRPFSNSEQKYQTVEGFGGEGLVDSHEYDGGFSDTTSASFGVDFLGGAVEDENTSQNEQQTYQYETNLNTSFTDEDNLYTRLKTGTETTPVFGPKNETKPVSGTTPEIEKVWYTEVPKEQGSLYYGPKIENYYMHSTTPSIYVPQIKQFQLGGGGRSFGATTTPAGYGNETAGPDDFGFVLQTPFEF